MKIGIAFTVTDRPEYLKDTLDSWLNVRSLEDKTIIFKVEPTDSLSENLKIINSFCNNTHAYTKVIVNESRAGVGVNQAQCLDLAFNEHDLDAIVMAEDDIIVSSDILEYFEHCFSEYEDTNILTVCAHRYTNHFGKDDVVFKEQSFDPWIWGTWKSKWKKFLESDWDLEKFELNGNIVGGFDYHIVYRILPKNNLVSIFPDTTRSKHIGMTGTYARPESYFDNPYYVADRNKKAFRLLDK